MTRQGLYLDGKFRSNVMETIEAARRRALGQPDPIPEPSSQTARQRIVDTAVKVWEDFGEGRIEPAQFAEKLAKLRESAGFTWSYAEPDEDIGTWAAQAESAAAGRPFDGPPTVPALAPRNELDEVVAKLAETQSAPSQHTQERRELKAKLAELKRGEE